jgi:hypothetical protein
MGAWYVTRYGNDKANTSFSAIIIVSRAVDFETFAGGVNPVDAWMVGILLRFLSPDTIASKAAQHNQ